MTEGQKEVEKEEERETMSTGSSVTGRIKTLKERWSELTVGEAQCPAGGCQKQNCNKVYPTV